MPTKFINFGCWNEGCCLQNSPVVKVLTEIEHEDSDSQFFIVNGDNYYPVKVKGETNITREMQLSKSFELLATKLLGVGQIEAEEAGAKAAEKARTNVLTRLSEEVRELSEGSKKELFLLLGNHDVEKTIQASVENPNCYIPIFEREFAIAINEQGGPRIIFPGLQQLPELLPQLQQLVMFKEIGTTLIIMIDTNPYVDEDVTCYPYIAEKLSFDISNKKAINILLREKQRLNIETYLQQKGRFQNIIICGHNPLVGFKNQKVKEKKSKIVIKGGIEVCSVELYSLLDEVIKPRGDNFYYLCADIHNYQKGIVTINNMTIQQHIVGIGGTELDADYDGNYISLTQDEEDIIKKSKSVKEAKTILEEIQKNPGRKLSNITLQIPNMSVSYTLEEHWSDYGYLVVTIQDDGTINFLAKKLQIKEIEELENGPLEDQLIAMGHASG